MARVKKSRRNGEWVTSVSRPQRHKRKIQGRHDPVERALHGVAQLPTSESRERGRRLVVWLDEFGPELLTEHLALRYLAQVPWPNVPRDRLPFRQVTTLEGLVDRLLARFPLKPVLYGPFRARWLPADARLGLAHLASHLGGGGSWKDARRRGWLPASATRRIVRAFLTAPAFLGPGAAWRRAQAVGQGLPAWVGSAVVQRASTGSLWEQDAYWRDTMQWLARWCDGEAEVAAVVGYLRHHPIELSGRTRASVLRHVEAWEEVRLRGTYRPPEDAPAWAPSGLDGRLGVPGWDLIELNRPFDLWTEGQVMRHCVWSYRTQVAAGTCSIWSLRFEGVRRLTVEVRTRDRRVVQARGAMNRKGSAEEWHALEAWKVRLAEVARKEPPRTC